MSVQEKIEKLAQKTIGYKESKPQKEILITRFLTYTKARKKESANYLSEALKSELSDYRNEISSNKPKSLYLAHYTSMETIFSILESSQNTDKNKMNGLKLFDASYSNDPKEGIYLKDHISKKYPWLEDAGQETDAFICSFFSGEKDIGDKVTCWQSYGKDGLGGSIQLPQIDLLKPDLLKQLNPVSYKNNFRDIIRRFENYFELGGLLYSQIPSNEDKKFFATEFWKAFNEIRFLYKHKGYEFEHEYRFIKVSSDIKKIKEDTVSVHPYLRRYIFDEQLSAKNLLVSGSKIVIGQRVMNCDHLCQYLKKIVSQKKLGAEVVISKIPYRKVWQ